MCIHKSGGLVWITAGKGGSSAGAPGAPWFENIKHIFYMIILK
jgi:hypothetical protein